jgi:DNA-binding PadR family transcriptional regulator
MGRLPRPLTLSEKEMLILQLLVHDGEMYGLQLVTASGGRLKRGTVYVTLGRMEEKGYISSSPEEGSPATGGLPRRLYQPTALGRTVLKAWREAGARLLPRFA